MTQGQRRFLSKSQTEDVARRIIGFASDVGETAVRLESWESGETRWARNFTSLASLRSNHTVNISRSLTPGTASFAVTNQLDDLSLEAAVREAENASLRSMPNFRDTRDTLVTERPKLEGYFLPVAWSDNTANLHPKDRSSVVDDIVISAEDAGMLSAGYISARSGSSARFTSRKGEAGSEAELVGYVTHTAAQCSLTVRDPEGLGSGWAGVSSFDWARINTEELAQRALEKCIASRKPVAIEPGRYTAILEPQAVHELIQSVIDWLPQRFGAEKGFGPFSAGTRDRPHESMVGTKILDERITISYDPRDPALATPLFEGVKPVTWVENGVLTVLGYDRDFYSIPFINEEHSTHGRGAYRIREGTASIKEMIAGTSRGLLVTRFADVAVIGESSLLSTGLTRDGLWLIENGKISTPVKNFRFTDSPLFAFNNVETIGAPAIPVFSPQMPAVVPPIKVKDFSFTSLIDAI